MYLVLYLIMYLGTVDVRHMLLIVYHTNSSNSSSNSTDSAVEVQQPLFFPCKVVGLKISMPSSIQRKNLDVD